MNGLLGDSWDDPRTSMMLALASGLLGGRGNLAQNLGAGLQAALPAYQQAQKMKMAQAQHDMQAKLWQSQIAENEAQAAQRKYALEQAQREQAAIQAEAQRLTTPTYPLGSSIMPRLDGVDRPPMILSLPQYDPAKSLAAGVPVSRIDELQKVFGPINVKKDETRIDPRTNQVLFSAPTDKWKDVGPNDRGQLIQVNERTGEKRAVGQGPLIGSISVNGKGENPFLDSFGSTVGKDQAAVLAEGRQAADALTTISQLRQITKSPSGVSGGPFADWQTFMLGAANQFGVQLDPNRLANDQNYRAEAIGLVLQQAGSLSKATEKEMAMIKESIADPTKFNAVSLDMRLAVLENKAKRNVAQAKALQDRISRTYPGKFPTLSSDTVIGTDTPFTPIPTPEQSRVTPAIGTRGKHKDGRDVEWDGKGWRFVK